MTNDQTKAEIINILSRAKSINAIKTSRYIRNICSIVLPMVFAIIAFGLYFSLNINAKELKELQFEIRKAAQCSMLKTSKITQTIRKKFNLYDISEISKYTAFKIKKFIKRTHCQRQKPDNDNQEI